MVSVVQAAEDFKQNGYVVLKAFDETQTAVIEQYARGWLKRLIKENTGRDIDKPLTEYHKWHEEEGVGHGEMLRAKNRHACPKNNVRDALLNDTLWSFVSRVFPENFDVWDEGLGWLGFRLVRPGMGDGYPPSCKAWGPAKKVISCWIPVNGRSSKETLCLSPKSHLQEFEKHLPEDSKFCKDEYRLSTPVEELEWIRPELKPGEVIFYHPRTIHTEDVKESPITRFNLEMRFNPVEM